MSRGKPWRPSPAQLEALAALSKADGKLSNQNIYRGYSGKHPWIHHRTGYFLLEARCVERVAGGYIRITEKGRRWLEDRRLG